MVSRFAILFFLSGLITILGAWNPAIAQRPGFGVPTFPRNSLRGRIHIRNGPFANVYREHWGGGLSNNAVALGGSALGAFVQVAPSLFGMLGGGGQEQSLFDQEAARDEDCAMFEDLPSNDLNLDTRREELTALRERQRSLLVRLGVSESELEEVMAEALPPAADSPGGDTPTTGVGVQDELN